MHIEAVTIVFCFALLVIGAISFCGSMVEMVKINGNGVVANGLIWMAIVCVTMCLIITAASLRNL